MKHTTCLGLLGALLLAGGSVGAPLRAKMPEKSPVKGYGQTSFIDLFEGQKRACVVAIGSGATYMGLYVFDRWGNCVAKDDSTESVEACDDLAVEWYPREAGLYTVEVNNFGPRDNLFNIAIH